MADDKESSGDYYADIKAVSTRGDRQGHVCCGCCCDTRRAVIIVNIVDICLKALSVALMSMVSNYVDKNYDDDYLKKQWDSEQLSVVLGVIMMALITLAFCGLGIYGALKYNKSMVIAAGVWHCINVFLSLKRHDMGGIIMAACFAYPHFVFSEEITNGIMTEENYPNEIHSCCCV
jgi:hypothetical protein